MIRQFEDDLEEFEPRVTPKPTTKAENVAVPSIPEVSLIFDKPSENKDLNQKISISPSFKKHESYAAWKQYNFFKNNDTNSSSQLNQHSYTHSPSRIQDTNKCNGSPGYSNTHRNPRKDTDNKEHSKESNRACSHDCKCSNSSQSHNKENSEYIVKGRTQYNCKEQCGSYNSENYKQKLNTSQAFPSNKPDFVRNYNQQNMMMTIRNTEHQRHLQNINSSPSAFPNNTFPPVSHPGYPYPYFDMNTYSFPQFYPIPNNNIDNQEVIKNLLQLVNTQSEQIQSLQAQVDNLLKMQKEILIDKMKYENSSQHSQQNGNADINSYDITENAKYTIPASQTVKKNIGQCVSTIEKNQEYSRDVRTRNQSEQMTEQGIMEKQVSIGVMTSFEFTVQNSPIMLDYENLQKEDMQNEITRKSEKHLRDACETLKRNKNCLTRLPVGQLENIVEDSESYLSSSQPHSSNLNASSSTRDLQEKRNSQDMRKARIPTERTVKSAQLYENALQSKPYKQMQPERGCEMEKIKKVDTQTCIKDTYSPYTYKDPSVNVVPCTPNEYAKIQNENRMEKIDKATKVNKCIEDSLVLSGGDLNVMERPPLTPEPSIHVDMQEYSSDEESDKIKRTSKVGWTFYNNVLGQVNQILQNSSTMDGNEHNDVKAMNNVEQDEVENKTLIETVKVATLEQLRKLGISVADKSDSKEINGPRKIEFDSSFYPRLDCQANITRATSGLTETNTSMHMKALALKYLSDEQLAELAVQKQGSTSLKQVMLSNMQGTNMSFATMRYLERYQLLPGKNNVQSEDIGELCVEASPKPDTRRANMRRSPIPQQNPFSQMPKTSCPSKILDISTLKQQPKLL